LAARLVFRSTTRRASQLLANDVLRGTDECSALIDRQDVEEEKARAQRSLSLVERAYRQAKAEPDNPL